MAIFFSTNKKFLIDYSIVNINIKKKIKIFIKKDFGI